MSREIKFRAWNGTAMEHGGFAIHATGKVVDLVESLTKIVQDSPIMQFTGLTDKNGKDIYEGDIVQCKHGWLGVIRYYPSRAHYACEEIVTCRVDSHAPIFDDWNELKITGNIYENPDLLEVKA